MMSTYNLSSDKIPAHIIEIIRNLGEILGDQRYDFMLIGATARDIILDGIHSLGVNRLTADVDFAVFVPEWGKYIDMMNKLIDSGKFAPTRITHKLIFNKTYEIDIVPFGKIQDQEGQYTWPPDNIKAMNVSGFAEVSEGGLKIVADEVDFKIASIPGICVMKLLAWKDRGIKDNRDGKDLGFILHNYIELKYDDLYSLHEDLMVAPEFDRIVTTARIMGRDIKILLKNNSTALSQINDILENAVADDEFSRLALAMKASGTMSFKIAYDSLLALLQGINDYK